MTDEGAAQPSEAVGGEAVGGEAGSERRRRLRLPLPTPTMGDEDSLAHRIVQQWAQLKVERRADPITLAAGPSNFRPAQVPFGVDLAAAWSWRFLVIVAAGYVVTRGIALFSVVVVPVVVALLVAALATPLVAALERVGIRRGLAAILVVVGGLATVIGLLSFAGQQVATGASDLADQTVKGLGQIREWLKDGPLNASESQIDDYINAVQQAISQQTRDGGFLGRVTEVGTAVTHVVAGFFIVLFATYFFLADGRRIWAWLVRLSPRAARARVDSSGQVAWVSLTQFVRATVIVAAVDAIGIAVGAWILGVPFVLAIAVLVFLGAFVPMIGATVAGSVAVLVALVDQGPLTALLMLGVIILVQQLEGHILQPFLMGRWVSVHPLGVILAIAAGVIVAGVAGALVAVPLAAALNAVVQHLAAETPIGHDPEEELAEDYEESGQRPEPVPDEDGVGDRPGTPAGEGRS